MTLPPVTPSADPPDARLLSRFVRDRDPVAFAELVRRYGPLVLGVCRRVIPDRHLADDAFQAAFVVLSRKPETVRAGVPLGNWLYGVAFRVALRARTMAGRRAKRETLTADVPERADQPREPDEALTVLDEEIARLPDHLRAAVVLCELQGVSRKEAAKQLGVAEGTLSSRLSAARKRLADALRRRGVALGVLPIGQTFLPTDLFAAAVHVSTAEVNLSPHLLKLVEGATPMLLLHKLKLAAVAALVLLAGGIGMWRTAESAAAPVPKAEKDDGLIWVFDGDSTLIAFNPDGVKVRELILKDGKRFLGLTRDGNKLAFVGKGGKSADSKETEGLTVHLRDIGIDLEGIDTGFACDKAVLDGHFRWFNLRWSPDGQRVIKRKLPQPGVDRGEAAYILFDRATKRERLIELPAEQVILDWSLDGTWLLVGSHPAKHLPSHSRWHKYTLADGKLHPIAEGKAGYFNVMSVAAGGNAILGYARDDEWEDGFLRRADRWGVARIDVTTGEVTKCDKFDRPEGYAYGWAVAEPDGDRFAFWSGVDRDDIMSQDLRLSIHNADGKEVRVVQRFNGNAWHLLGWFPGKPAPRRKNAPVPKAGRAERLLIVTNGKVVLADADGKKPKELSTKAWKTPPRAARLSPDGGRIAYWFAHRTGGQQRVVIRDVGDDGEGTKAFDCSDGTVIWSADGNKLYGGGAADGGKRENWVYDLKTGKRTPLDMGDDCRIAAATADGTRLVLHRLHGKQAAAKVPVENSEIVTYDLATGAMTRVGPEAEVNWAPADVFPDSKRLLVYEYLPANFQHRHLSLDPATGTTERLAAVPPQRVCDNIRLSPDGKRVAYSLVGSVELSLHLNKYPVVVADADGQNPTTVYESNRPIDSLDWR